MDPYSTYKLPVTKRSVVDRIGVISVAKTQESSNFLHTAPKNGKIKDLQARLDPPDEFFLSQKNPEKKYLNDDGVSKCKSATIQKIQDQRVLLENLRSESYKFIHQMQATTKYDMNESSHYEDPGECIKSKINCVLGLAVELVNTLEEMQNSVPECQKSQEASTQCADLSNSAVPEPHMQSNDSHQQPQSMNQQEICNQIHCLVNQMDQLSQHFDSLLGNSNCPYHEGHWMPQCSEFMSTFDPNCQQQWVETNEHPMASEPILNSFVDSMPIYYPPNSTICPDDWIDPCLVNTYSGNKVQVTQDPLSFIEVDVTGDSKKTSLPDEASYTGMVGSTSARPLPHTRSQEELFSELDGKPSPSSRHSIKTQPMMSGESHVTSLEEMLNDLNDRIGNTWHELETFSSTAAQWRTLIKEFFQNQLHIIQKLLTGQMSLRDAPFEVAFLTVSFILGIIVGYKLISYGSAERGSREPSILITNPNFC